MSSYYVAFSNDSREWNVLDDGYAEWVGFQDVFIFSFISFLELWLPNLFVALKSIFVPFTYPQVVPKLYEYIPVYYILKNVL